MRHLFECGPFCLSVSPLPNKLPKLLKQLLSQTRAVVSANHALSNLVCQLTLKCHGHRDIILSVTQPGSERRRSSIAVSSHTCHPIPTDWHVLTQITTALKEEGFPDSLELTQDPHYRIPSKVGKLGLAWLREAPCLVTSRITSFSPIPSPCISSPFSSGPSPHLQHCALNEWLDTAHCRARIATLLKV